MRQARIAEQVIAAARGTVLFLPRAENDPRDAGGLDGAGAHEARLQRHDEGEPGQLPVAACGGGGPDRRDLRVPGRILVTLAGVDAGGDDGPGLVNEQRTDRDVPGRGAVSREFTGALHPRGVLRNTGYRHDIALVGRQVTVNPMRVHVADHPLITHKLTVLRDKRTTSPVFRSLTEELVTLLAYEATREVRTNPVTIQTPVTETVGVEISTPRPLVVPILRAGLGMLEGMVKLLPTAEVGFLGMQRDEETFEPVTYAERLPDDLSGRQCFVLDPMLATGGSLGAAIEFLFKRGADDVTAICILAAPEGLEALEKMTEGRNVNIVLGAVDEKLDEHGYIVPGLGDAGDRLYGLV